MVLLLVALVPADVAGHFVVTADRVVALPTLLFAEHRPVVLLGLPVPQMPAAVLLVHAGVCPDPMQQWPALRIGFAHGLVGPVVDPSENRLRS